MASSAGPERVIALAGPTASGKTAAALAIAREHDAEIVSVDSALVYRGMDIGTAKPTREERAAVLHHLIDIRDPRQPYSAAEFAADARRLVQEINARGRLALLVGGTMLYFKALFEGLDAMPPADAAVRAQLEAQAAREGWPALHAELARVDAATAARLAPNDAQRIQRALEVFRVSGRPLSSFHGRERDRRAPRHGAPHRFSRWNPPTAHGCTSASLGASKRCWRAASWTKSRPCARAATWRPTCPACAAWATGRPGNCSILQEATGGEASFPLATLRDRGIFATRQLAKRQLTWLRGMPRRHVIACDAPDAQAQLLQAVREAL